MDTTVTCHRPAKLPDGLSKRAISAQLERILGSPSFVNSERLSRLLRHAVQSATDGKQEQLKEYSLALSVFDKHETFDPRFDPIVRVEAGRLRTRLTHYYETEGREDPLIIDLPKGSYVPRFASQAAKQTASEARGQFQTYSSNWIAVLPFADHSPGGDKEYFCDGMTEELINALTKLRGLRVSAWTSALRLRVAHDYRKIAEQLKVGTIVAGSVRKDGERLRITVQLIDTSNGCYLWSEIYDRELKDVFAIQEELSQAIAGMLKVQIADDQNKSMVKRYTESVDAYKLYLKGRYCWNQRSEQSLRKSIEFFEQAILLDQRYAPAYSGLADSLALLGNSGAVPPKDVKAKAMNAALKAVELGPMLAEAHTTLGHFRATYCWDWKSACAEYKAAMALNPAYATVHHWYAITYLAPLGLLDDALTEMQKAEELDPLSVSIKRDIAIILCNSGRFENAIAQCKRAIELEPSFQTSYWALGLAYEGLKEYEQAVGAFEQALRGAAIQTPRLLGALGHSYALWGKLRQAEEVLNRMNELACTRYVPPFDYALVNLGLGRRETSFHYLEQAYRCRSYDLVSIKVDPRFDGLRADPKFEKLLKRLGLQTALNVVT